MENTSEIKDLREGTKFDKNLWMEEKNIKNMKNYFNVEIIWGVWTLIPFLIWIFPVTLIIFIILGIKQRGYNHFPTAKAQSDKRTVRIIGWCTLIPLVGWIFSIILIVLSILAKNHFNENLMKEKYDL